MKHSAEFEALCNAARQEIREVDVEEAQSIKNMGYTNVSSMAGGWKAWCAAFPELCE